MGKKGSAGKDKKLLRKAETVRAQLACRSTKEAYQVEDLLLEFPAFKAFSRNGLTAELASFWSKDMQPELQDWAFRLCKQNMQDLYKGVWGWNDAKKRSELQHETARFVVAFEVPASEAHQTAPVVCGAPPSVTVVTRLPVAFVHFRFEVEATQPVLYIYDIQLEQRVQRKGLGKLLMKLVELVAIRLQLPEVMLTVMKANKSALAMYERLGYAKHHSCPSEGVDGQPGYLIMSKVLPVPKKQPPATLAPVVDLQ